MKYVIVKFLYLKKQYFRPRQKNNLNACRSTKACRCRDMHSRHALLTCFSDMQVSQKTRRLALNLQNSSSMHVAAPKSTGLCVPKILRFIGCISFFWIICNSYSSPEFKPIFSISLCKDWRYTVLLSTEYLKVQRHALKACRRKHVAF